MKKIFSAFLAITILMTFPAPSALAAASFTDIPEGSWAIPEIEAAVELKLIEGVGDGKFGYGNTMTRGQFVTVLSRMFGWNTEGFTSVSFSDVEPGKWYYKYIEAAAANGAVDSGGSFRPDEPITREEMAVMLIRALGYKTVAESIDKEPESYPIPFADVTTNRGYITIAYDIGMTNGKSADKFAPESYAKREEAAAMMLRVYNKYYSETEHLSAFYAFSSYDQIGLTDSMDAVHLGWSRMTLDPATNSVLLRTTSSDGNEYHIPSGYQSAVSYMQANSTAMNLSVYMDTSISYSDGISTLSALLSNAALRSAAVSQIINELTVTYNAIGFNPYTGVTIDFEGLRGEDAKANFNAFLTELRAELDKTGKELYVAVHPALASGPWYDGYDYRAIGEVADKIILMAYDYNARSLEGFINSSYYRNTALTPISQVYYSLRAITDAKTGVADRSKIILGLNTAANIGWEINSSGLLVSPDPIAMNISIDTVHIRLTSESAEPGWSDTYHNPYVIYNTEAGEKVFLWYEDSRSISDKIHLARLFGVTGFSVWRLGEIPDLAGDVYYNVYEVLK